MRRLAFITALIAALAAAAPASGAVLLAKNCTGSSCSALQANGTGWLSVVGNGAEWGTVKSGTIWMRDRKGQSNPKNWLTHHAGRVHWTYLGNDGWKVTSKKSMTISASTDSFWVKLQGPGISVSGEFDGTGAIQGSGQYQIGARTWHAWPSQATSLHF